MHRIISRDKDTLPDRQWDHRATPMGTQQCGCPSATAAQGSSGVRLVPTLTVFSTQQSMSC